MDKRDQLSTCNVIEKDPNFKTLSGYKILNKRYTNTHHIFFCDKNHVVNN